MNKNLYILPKATPALYSNSIEAWVPQYWANESMEILVENLQIAALVYRDFENILAQSGDTVNTRKPGTFKTKRKTLNSDVTIQDATVTNIPVVLNQHKYVTFLIRDREQSRSFADLVEEYLKPAMISLAQDVDRMLLGQAQRFLRSDGQTAGALGTDASVASILECRKNLNNNKVDLANRSLIISSKDEAALLSLEIFINAAKVGDDGTALREASLGRRLGFNVFMCQNVCSPTATADTNTNFLVNKVGGYAAGAVTMAIDVGTGALTTGEWFTVAGDMIPHVITAHSENTAGNTTNITFTPGLKKLVADDAQITVYTYNLVNQAGTVSDADGNVINASTGYPAGWEEPIAYDGNTAQMQIGQFLTINAGGSQYTVIDTPTSSTILLDRPLVAAISDEDKIFPGPNGTYNFAFVPQAIALVCRPMALPKPGTGAIGAVANYANISVRVVWSYDAKKQGMMVTVDMLCGVAILEALKGELMLC